MPQSLVDERVKRFRRAFQLSLKHDVLPHDQRPTEADEVAYLRPYLDQVIKEKLSENKE